MKGLSRRFVFVSLAWCTAVFLVWRAMNPLSPTASIEFREPAVVSSFTQAGELAVFRFRSGPYSRASGPFEFWALPEGKKVAETFSADDRLVSFSIPPTGEIVIRRDEAYFVANARTGKLIAQVPSETDCKTPVMFANGTRVLYTDGTRLRLFDLVASRELWVADGYENVLGLGPGIVMVTPLAMSVQASGVANPGPIVIALDLESGQPDHRFDHLGVLNMVLMFEKCPIAVLTSNHQQIVCNVKTGEALWTLPATSSLINFRLENNDTELCSDFLDRAGNVVVARWRVSDGMVITPFPESRQPFALRQRAGNSRYAVDSLNFEGSTLAKGINRWLVKWKVPAAYQFQETGRTLRVMDLERGSTLGDIHTKAFPILNPDGSGFAIQEGQRVHYFALPPARNWGWLMRFGFGPPLVVWILLRVWKRSRREVRTSASEAAVAVNDSER